jgi:hypothetical protein
MRPDDTEELDFVSVLDYLPQKLRTQLTRERLEFLRTIGELQQRASKHETADYRSRQEIAEALGEERGAQNTTRHLTWLIRRLIAQKR